MPDGNGRALAGSGISDQFMVGDRLVSPPGTGAPSAGYFRFESLIVLDSLIAQWKTITDRISACQRQLTTAYDIVQPPAQDPASDSEAEATRQTLVKAIEHNKTMREYARDYVHMLTAARQAYAATEAVNSATLRSEEG
ncbi:PE domain-containing protein [Actinokineospora cianjurensis]|uniref:PE family protein n=1 Tax=Actinokineospora cianjurensis TaxID=585224 RepID=A0A421B684_9PSEU|nr:PE domain-containing protein [Actinokineospora cianjurensis]RLK59788.1 PE family protein [Actinokineospora cianjurensis]